MSLSGFSGVVCLFAFGTHGTFSNYDQDATKYAVFSILDSSSSSTLIAAPGQVKSTQQVITMELPWETNVSDGCCVPCNHPPVQCSPRALLVDTPHALLSFCPQLH
jgi:hypothetical protein